MSARGRVTIDIRGQIYTQRQNFRRVVILSRRRTAKRIRRTGEKNPDRPGVDELLKGAEREAEKSLSNEIAVVGDDNRLGRTKQRQGHYHNGVRCVQMQKIDGCALEPPQNRG